MTGSRYPPVPSPRTEEFPTGTFPYTPLPEAAPAFPNKRSKKELRQSQSVLGQYRADAPETECLKSGGKGGSSLV